MKTEKNKFSFKQMILWVTAMLIGGTLGALNNGAINDFFNFTAQGYTNLFKFVAIPTIALAITTTLASLGGSRNAGKLFLNTVTYTLLTTLAASLAGVLLYKLIAPGTLPDDIINQGVNAAQTEIRETSVYKHILDVIPDNILRPFFNGNVLSIVLVAAAAGLALAYRKDSDNIQQLLKVITGLQELLFTFIKALVWSLPLGIMAFSGQLAAQVSAGTAVAALGKYVLVVLSGNLLQFFVVLPIFLLLRKINPAKVFVKMLPAVLMAFFTKSSAATLPVTIASAENNLGVKKEVSRFVLPICCTINMNGCAAFILVTSLFVMQNGGVTLTAGTIALWVLISVISAVGNAGVPMGCYFLTLSLMAGMNMPIGVMGVILPIYAVIDMVETGVNVWSDACVCAMVDKAMQDGNNR